MRRRLRARRAELRAARTWQAAAARSALVWLVLALVAWLDADRHLVAQHAAVVGYIVAGISWIATTLAAAAEITVTYLAAVVSWLAGRVADIFTSTGAMFARVWHWMEGFYGDVIKPSITWLTDKFEALRAWLKETMQPVLEFLNDVRTELRAIYELYVRPVLDAIDLARAGLKLLADLGVEWAQSLDRALGELESWISENFARVLGKVNQVIGVVNAVVTGDLLFQRAPFLRTLRRDVGAVHRELVAARMRTLDDGQRAHLAFVTHVKPHRELVDNIVAYYRGADNGDGASIRDATTSALASLETTV